MSEFQSTSIWLTSSRALQGTGAGSGVATSHPSEKERSSPGVDCARASEGDAMDDSSSAHFSVLFSVLFSELCLRDEIFLGVPAGAAALGSRLGLKHVARVELDRPNMRGLRAVDGARALSEPPSASPSRSHCRTFPPLSGRCLLSEPKANRRPLSCWRRTPRPHR
eukprot:367896-Prymnesium_polylepis.1